MTRFKNISELDPETCKILIYSVVGADEGVSSAQFVAELDWAGMYYKKCQIHVNTPGGEVFEGIAIRNAIMNSKMEIEFFINGIAASIGFLIIKCGKPIYMSRWARLMVHRVMGGSIGNADELARNAADVQSVENDLISIIAEETKLTTDEVKTKWFDGADHWITATEAFDLGLITDIYDGVQVDSPATGNVDAAQLYNKFNNILKFETMKWVNYFKRAKLRDEATEEEAVANYDALEKRATDAEAGKTAAETERDKLKAELDAKNKADADKIEAEDKTFLENASKDGRIKDDQKEHYGAFLKTNRAAAMAIINGIAKPKKLMSVVGSESGEEPEGREKWTFSDYAKKDPAALQNKKVNDPESYKALFKAEYKTEPKM